MIPREISRRVLCSRGGSFMATVSRAQSSRRRNEHVTRLPNSKVEGVVKNELGCGRASCGTTSRARDR